MLPATEGSCIDVRPTAVGMAAAIEWQVLAVQVFAATADWRVSRP